MNYHQVSEVALTPDAIDCIVFWTKDPSKMLNNLDMLTEFRYYFQVTINAYDKTIERNVPPLDTVVQSFQALSRKLGRDKTIWRYDPILLTDEMDMEKHIRNFEMLSEKLEGYTDLCIISFIDIYTKIERNMNSIACQTIREDQMLKLGGQIFKTGQKHGIQIKACSEKMDLSSVGIGHAKCIDDQLISKITGRSILAKKDKNQRESCGCVESVDIGAYNTCRHGCLYCYANHSDISVKNNLLRHDPNSPMLIGNIEHNDVVKKRLMQ
jgi:hypothetical protein